MIDTVRLVGPADLERFPPDMTQLVTFLNRGKETVPGFMYTNKKGFYRIFYYHGRNDMHVEFNISKLIFKNNAINYDQNASSLNYLLRLFGAYFFPSYNYYVSRIDLGSVVLFDSKDSASVALERYRVARPERAGVDKYKSQNYKNSVFYQFDGWSLKLYNKGAELIKNKEYDNVSELVNYDTNNMLRFEKTYRPSELARLGMSKTPYKGVHIDEFDISILVNDFVNTLSGWRAVALPYELPKGSSSVMRLCSIIDNQGKLDDAFSSGAISKSTYYRYRKMKREHNFQTTDINFFAKETRPTDLHFYKNVLTFGPSIIHGI